MVPTLAVPTRYGFIGRKLPQPDYPPALITFMFCPMVITIIIDLTSNSMVILAVGKNKKLRNSGNIFVVSLSVADMLVAIYPYPLMLHAMAIGGWDLSKFRCQVVRFITGLSVVDSIFNIVAIAINHYCYICHSLQYERIFSLRNTCIYLVASWIMTILDVLPNMYIGTIKYDPCTYTCIFNYLNNPIFAVTMVCIHFVIPVLIVDFCYVRIWMKVLVARDPAGQNPDNQLTEVCNFLTMFVVFLLFAVCWCPINVLTDLVSVSPKEMVSKIPKWLYLTAHFIAYFISSLNAVLYGLLNENFQREYWTIFHAIRHPILFLSGIITDMREMWKAGALAITHTCTHACAHACDQIPEQAHEQDHAYACPALEEIPMNIRHVPLPSNAVADQPELASGHPKLASGHSRPASTYHKSVSDHHKSIISHSKLASGHSKSASGHTKPATVYTKPASVHFKGDSDHFKPPSVHFKPASNHHKPVTDYHILTGSPSKSAFSPVTSHPKPTIGHVKPATSYPEPSTANYPEPAATSYPKPAITGYPEPSTAGHYELTASCHSETTATGHLECDVTDLPELSSNPASPLEPPAATDPLDSTVVTNDSNDYHEVVVIDAEVDSDEMAV